MSTQDHMQAQSASISPVKTKGEIYEGIAFTFCKAATIILVTRKFALPVAAGAATAFYILAALNGQKDTRCLLKMPLLIATFWGAVCFASLYTILRPMLGH